MTWLRRLSLAIWLGVAGLLGYWAADRTPPVAQIENRVIGSAYPGGWVEVTSTVLRQRSCRTLLQKVIVDGAGQRLPLPDQEWAAAPGRVGWPPDTFSAFLPVPSSAQPGPATLRGIIVWRCNPLHVVWPIVTTWEAPFLVER